VRAWRLATRDRLSKRDKSIRPYLSAHGVFAPSSQRSIKCCCVTRTCPTIEYTRLTGGQVAENLPLRV
jgi:hypothetical protein